MEWLQTPTEANEKLQRSDHPTVNTRRQGEPPQCHYFLAREQWFLSGNIVAVFTPFWGSLWCECIFREQKHCG